MKFNKFLMNTLLSLTLASLPKCSSVDDKTTAPHLAMMNAIEKIVDTEVKDIEKMLQKDCFDTKNKIICQTVYGKNKRETEAIKEIVPQLKGIIEKDNKRYYSRVVIGNKETTIEIYSTQNRNVVFNLSKKQFSQREKEEILKLEEILNDLFDADPRKIYDEGKEKEINCVFYGTNGVKCIFEYNGIQISNDSLMEVITPKRYRSIEIDIYNGKKGLH